FCNPRVWHIMNAIFSFQKQKKSLCPVAEIGVFNGTYFLGLVNLYQKPQNAAFDLFEMQNLATDGIIYKNHRFFEHLKVMTNPEHTTVPYKMDSLEISEEVISRLLSNHGKFSVFSIDGAHDAEHVSHDFEIACRLTDKYGVIAVDDYLNPTWPGVGEALAKKYFFKDPVFVPLAYSVNKLFLCHFSVHKEFLNYVINFTQKNYPTDHIEFTRRLGFDSINTVPDEKSKLI
ncbi:MAG: class I SAM-dependent methyltransferase, partial [Proteobacteria bacterium]|nr:class I SAM-dependent methyltransferase [Pseudomonadota bacterium]